MPPGSTTREPVGRLFIAVALPPAVRAELAALRAALEGAGVPRLRWVQPDGIHLTLKFLGDTPLRRRPEIEAAMEEAGAAGPEHTLSLGGLGLFGGRRPRVLWAGLDGDVAAVIALAARLDAALAERGFEPERRPLTPHLTLARVPDRAGDEQRRALRRIVEACAAPAPLPLAVDALRLIQSDLTPGGARYRTLAVRACGA